MAKQSNFTDRTIKALKPAEKGKRYDEMDYGTGSVAGLGVRVDENGRKAFMLVKRFPGSPNPTRLLLGIYPTLSLADAREKASGWIKLIGKGIHPRQEEERKRRAELRKQENSFGNVAEAYFIHIKRQNLRRTAETEREIRRELVSRWEKRPITDITRHDLLEVVEAALKRGSPWQAHHIFSYTSRLFNWAIERGTFGLESSPTHGMRPARVIGAKKPRLRVLTDAELKALWNVSGELGYPYGPFVRLLMLTGQRKTEVAGAQWPEFHIEKRIWEILPGRMKMDAAHVVPLTSQAIAVLESLPRFESGKFLFSYTFGRGPINSFSKAKEKVDSLMGKELPTIGPWVFHDIRRTVRTHLSALPVEDLVRELVIAHAKPGLHKIYDQYAYLNEKREALDLWAARLRSIVEPPPANVVKIKKARA
jgi:integrase